MCGPGESFGAGRYQDPSEPLVRTSYRAMDLAAIAGTEEAANNNTSSLTSKSTLESFGIPQPYYFRATFLPSVGQSTDKFATEITSS
jgi:hypothetical protein